MKTLKEQQLEHHSHTLMNEIAELALEKRRAGDTRLFNALSHVLSAEYAELLDSWAEADDEDELGWKETKDFLNGEK